MDATATTHGLPPGPGGEPIAAQILEISLISAQDLTPLSKSMRTYAVAWINPSQKVTTQTDHHHTNPTWNDKFTFHVDIQALFAINANLHVEIYTVSWFRHVLVGTVNVLVSDLLAPAIRGSPQQNTRFVALQIRRPSGTPQGILNMGITFTDNSLRAMLRQHHHENFSEVYGKANNPPREAGGDHGGGFRKKIQLWRRSASESEINHDDFPLKSGSVCNGSMINGSVCNGSICNGSMIYGSELCSDIGPSASIVAADMAMKMQPPPMARPHVIKHVEHADDSSSIVEEMTMEDAMAKGYIPRVAGDRWRRVVYDGDQSEMSAMGSRHARGNSDGGLFSCIVYGIEIKIACGGGGNNPGGGKHGNAAGADRRRELH
ncbi:hypothetical protein SASPL_127432 [Salvia splendens]|uniref:C2 domain-containing protein n=1 Tax=Salvia splendens TaxID=180675 RepID=A0A8X8ZLW9_SALSN|nr:uncharacterized protein LOC121751741 [Salvia splendens]KAG6409393.1 hypothetical protein SASPL_127432 [Salvia splendens]